MTDKQKQTIIKLREEITELKLMNSALRAQKGLKKLPKMPRVRLPTKGMIIICQECKQKVMSNQKHDLDDCNRHKDREDAIK